MIRKDELIDNIYSDKKDIIDEKYNKYYDSLSCVNKKSLERCLNDDDCDKIKDNLKLLLYNKRHMIVDNKKNNEIINKKENIKKK